MKGVVKRMVLEVKRKENEKLSVSINENFKENNKQFWKEVNGVRKGEIQRVLSVKILRGRS